MAYMSRFAKFIVWPGCLLLGIVFAARNLHATATSDRELYFEDIKDLEQQFAQGSLTARQFATLFIERIHALDQAGPSIHSVIELNPDALEIASKLDSEPALGSLHGIPVW
jgi:amidase